MTRQLASDSISESCRLISIVFPRQVVAGPEAAIYGTLLDRKVDIDQLQSILDSIIEWVGPIYQDKLQLLVCQFESLTAPDQIGVAVLASPRTRSNHRFLKEAAKMIVGAIKHLGQLSFDIAEQSELFYTQSVAASDFPSWHESAQRQAVLKLAAAGKRGDLTIETLGGGRELLEVRSEERPHRRVGRLVIRAMVMASSALDPRPSALFGGAAVEGDAEALEMTQKTRRFLCRVGVESVARELALPMNTKQPLRLEVAVEQDGLQPVFLLHRWEALPPETELQLD